MGVTNLDAIALPADGTITAGGAPLSLKLIGRGSTPATGWTSIGSGQHATKAVTVPGAAVGDLVSVTFDSAPISGSSPSLVDFVFGRVTAANTLTLYYVEFASGAPASSVTTNGGSATIGGAVLYAVQR